MKKHARPLLGALCVLIAASMQADVREGLVAYWPLNTATGSFPMITPDAVAGNDMTGPLMDSSFSVVPGRYGNAVQFNGSAGDYLFFTNAPGADTGLPVAANGSWSYALWVNGASGQPDQTTFFAEASSITANWRFAMEMESTAGQTDKTRYFLRDGGNSVKVNTLSTVPVLDSTWHHVAYTYDNDSKQFVAYVDGQPDYTNTFTYTSSSSFNQVGLGALVRTTVGVPFAGQLDDVALWSRVLSPSEVQEVMSNSIATPVPAFPPVIISQPSGATNLYVGDSFTLSVSCNGTRPFYYQWTKDGTNYGGNVRSFTLSNLTTSDSGAYQVVITNASGLSATSDVAQITVSDYASPDLTSGMVAYYPCDAVVAGKTPDLVSAYDMTLVNMTSGDLITGKWASGLQFSKSPLKYGYRSPALAGDALPVFRRTNCTISVWVQGLPHSGIFLTEGNSGSNNDQFTFGANGTSTDKLRIYFRTHGNVVLNEWTPTTASVWDGNWHNIVYVQRDVGGTLKANIYVDGNLDPIVPKPDYDIQVDGDGFAWLPRPSGATGGDFALDEVCYWERQLSPAEIALLQTGYITNPPTRLTPLAIGSFKADLAAVVSGDSTKLRWDVPGNITSASISHVGDVTAITTAGGGTANIAVSVTNTTTYTLMITRGAESVSKSVTIGAVSSVETNWSLVENFDFYPPGPLSDGGIWIDMYSDTTHVVQPAGCNRLAKVAAASGAGGAAMLLNDLTVTAGQARTLFFRMTMPAGSPAAALTQFLGVSDRVASFPYQWLSQYNAGPLTFPLWDSSNWWLGVSTNLSAWISTNEPSLMADSVYNVWVDITNVTMVNAFGSRIEPDESDIFSVHIQKEGDAGRTTLFSDVFSNRALNTQDEFSAHQPDDNINRVVMGNSVALEGVLFDDIYLSKSGYSATVPRAAGYAGLEPSLRIEWSGSQWQVVFEGTLEEASAVDGTWSEVSGATSPHPVSTTGEQKFYRAVCD